MEGDLVDDPLLFSITDEDDDEEVVTVLDPLHQDGDANADNNTSSASLIASRSAASRSAAATVSGSVSTSAAALMCSLNSSLSEEKATASPWSPATALGPPPPASIVSGVRSAASLLKGNEERIVAEHLGEATTIGSTSSAAASESSKEHPLMSTAAPTSASTMRPGQIGGPAIMSPAGASVVSSVPSAADVAATTATAAAAVSINGTGNVVENGTGTARTQMGGGVGPLHHQASHDAINRSNAITARAQKSASAWYENVGSLARKTANTLSDAAVQAGTAVANAAAQADVAVSQLDQRVGGHQGVGGTTLGTAVDRSRDAPQHHPLQQTHALPHPQGNQPDQTSLHELDNAKKSALLSSALSESRDSLLPGERVIMFLSSLTNVQDSAETNTGINTDYDLLNDNNTLASVFSEDVRPHRSLDQAAKQSGDRVIWCCAMTFYRVILFTYRERDFLVGNEKNDDDGSGRCSTVDNSYRHAVLEELVRTAYVSRQYQLAQGKDFGSSKRHHILQMPLASIERVERVSNYAGAMATGSQSPFAGNSLGLVLYGKDNFRYLRFTAPNYNDAVRAHEALNTYAFPGRRNLGYLFAFESRRTEVMASIRKITEPVDLGKSAGAQLQQQQQQMITARSTPRWYEALQEFERLGVLRPRDSSSTLNKTQQNHHDVEPNRPQLSPWKTILTANSTYTLCPSYPSVLVGPRQISDEDAEGQRILRRVAAFRSEGRMPALTWGNSIDGASIWRSSQPRIGLQGNRSSADERYLRAIADCASNVAVPPEKARSLFRIPSRQFLRMLIGGTNEGDLLSNGPTGPPFGLKIMDLRPKSSAVANRTQGA